MAFVPSARRIWLPRLTTRQLCTWGFVCTSAGLLFILYGFIAGEPGSAGVEFLRFCLAFAAVCILPGVVFFLAALQHHRRDRTDGTE
jgi:hypothetical protein